MLRILARCGAVLALAPAGASAEVFVRVNAPSRTAECVAAAGDLVVARRGGWVEVSTGAGPWRRLLKVAAPELNECPGVAAAPDGTAVVSDGQRLVVRRPGGGFGPPVRLGRFVDPPALAAANGGWVAAAWTRPVDPKKLETVLTAAVIAPSGAMTRTRLGRGVSDHPAAPRVAVSPGGSATVAWATRRHWRVARAAGARFGAASDLPGGVGTRFTTSGLALTDRLVAWAAADGIRVQAEGEPVRVVAPMTDRAAVVAATAADGTAAIAFAGADNKLFAVDRAPGGDWAAPHPISLPGQADAGDFPLGGDIALIAADGGRVAAAWAVTPDRVRVRLVAAAGRAGGEWSPAAFVSAPTRDAAHFSLSVDAAGAPRLLWIAEPGRRLREARIAAAPPTDTAAPALVARIPKRLPATRTGRIRLGVRIRCSEACDARVTVEGEAVARSLSAGRLATVRLTGSRDLAQRLLLGVRDHRLHVTVEVADRAGNVARRTATVRVRLLDRPLRSFRVGARHDFAMFSRAGDRAVGRLVNALIERLAAGAPFRELVRRYGAGLRTIERRHREVRDTAVLDEIQRALEVPVTRAGYDVESLITSA